MTERGVVDWRSGVLIVNAKDVCREEMWLRVVRVRWFKNAHLHFIVVVENLTTKG